MISHMPIITGIQYAIIPCVNKTVQVINKSDTGQPFFVEYFHLPGRADQTADLTNNSVMLSPTLNLNILYGK
jgi:hypothetical protein